MPFVQIPSPNGSTLVELFQENWGQGAPVVLIHGRPPDRQAWELQSVSLAGLGLRVIA